MIKNATTSLFDKELQDAIDGKLSENHIFSLGVPGEILQKCGFPKGQGKMVYGNKKELQALTAQQRMNVADVNGIVMDFKEITARSEKNVSKNTLGHCYQNGIYKEFSQGVAIYLHNFSNDFVKTHMTGEKTSPTHNGLALFFHEDTGTFQLIDMQKIRAAYKKQLQSIAPAVSSDPYQSTMPSSFAEHCLNKYTTASRKKSRKSKDDDFGIGR